ncbi:MAG TPA: hypothetical protein VK841_04290 [Polyangiaceae bacterium]|nr:hypothetical protein [Polyangiaceae bacterium]
MRLSRPAVIAFGLAFAFAPACSRSALEEEVAGDPMAADAASSEAPPGDAFVDTGTPCGRGVLCGSTTTCPAGEQLCNVGCPERQNFAPPVCMAGPCPGSVCPTASGDAASR